jgi:hypothetical protein
VGSDAGARITIRLSTFDQEKTYDDEVTLPSFLQRIKQGEDFTPVSSNQGTPVGSNQGTPVGSNQGTPVSSMPTSPVNSNPGTPQKPNRLLRLDSSLIGKGILFTDSPQKSPEPPKKGSSLKFGKKRTDG